MLSSRRESFNPLSLVSIKSASHCDDLLRKSFFALGLPLALHYPAMTARAHRDRYLRPQADHSPSLLFANDEHGDLNIPQGLNLRQI
jgi:hypothetical protein